MRAMWKGSIAFGLVNVPVKLYSATETHDVRLHQVHDEDGGRIRYQRKCEICGEIVAYEHIDKAYEEDGKTVVLRDEDLKALPVERSREIEVVQFVPSKQVDPIRLEKSYYLEPTGSALKAYTLLRRVLDETERTAIVRISIRQRSRLAVLRVHDDVLMVQTMLWDDEIRAADFASLDEKPRIQAKELDLAKAIVKELSGDFAPDEYEDEYQVQLRQLVDAKLEQGDAIDTAATFGEEAEEAEVLDLMEALQRSVERRKGAAKGSGSSKDSGSKGSGSSKDSGSKDSGSRSTSKRSKSA